MPHPESHKRRLKRVAKLSEVLDVSPLLKRLGVRDGDQQMAIYQKWPEIVGQAVARNTQPVRLNRGTLTVAVSTPAWMHNLSMMKPQLLANLAQAFGKGMVSEIRFKAADYDMGRMKGQ